MSKEILLSLIGGAIGGEIWIHIRDTLRRRQAGKELWRRK